MPNTYIYHAMAACLTSEDTSLILSEIKKLKELEINTRNVLSHIDKLLSLNEQEWNNLEAVIDIIKTKVGYLDILICIHSTCRITQALWVVVLFIMCNDPGYSYTMYTAI